MGTEGIWAGAFVAKRQGSWATRERATRTWNSLIKFAKEKKWDLAPATITPKQLRIYLENRCTVISSRSVQNEASHLRRAIEGAGRVIGNVRDEKNSWSSTRLSVPEATRIGGKAAADPARWQEAKPQMPKDVLAVVELVQEMGLRKKEAVMSGPSLAEWSRELSKPDSLERGCYLNVTWGTKGGRPRFQYVPVGQVEATKKAVSTALTVGALHKGDLIDAPDLEAALKRYSNCISRLGLSGNDSGHGLRRAFAQRQFSFYRDSGRTEKESLSLLSTDLGHGDGRGRWVWNNYLMGGSGETA